MKRCTPSAPLQINLLISQRCNELSLAEITVPVGQSAFDPISREPNYKLRVVCVERSGSHQ